MSAYHRNALPRGYELQEYTIKKVLGHGGFGVTYLAKDNSLGYLVAIKEYLPHGLADRVEGNTEIIPNLDSSEAVRTYHWGLKRFLKEARALARFKNNNIVRVLRYMEANGSAYMVMEYEEGESLGTYLRQHGNSLDEDGLIKLFLPILTGIGAMHDAGLLHLDIKPDNIYLRKDNTPMLIDFGSARQALRGQSKNSRVILTPGYAPIEQYPDQGEQGPWTDLYAVGSSMYRCIRGKRPQDALERYKMILKVQVDPITPAAKFGKGRFSERTLDCIDWAMQPFHTDRPKKARELQDALLGSRQPEKKAALEVHRGKTLLTARKGKRKFIRSGPWKKILIALFVITGLIGATVHYWPYIEKKWPQMAKEIKKQIPKKFYRKIKIPDFLKKL